MGFKPKITVTKNGPYKVSADGVPMHVGKVVGGKLELVKELDHGATFFLCRCGLSKNQPMCDGSHTKAQYVGDGAGDVAKNAEITKKVDASCLGDGPQIVLLEEEGCSGGILVKDIDLFGQDNKQIPVPGTYVLCRCIRSDNKPFCDGTHVEIGYADGIKL